jgi:hypothetical protein
MVELADRRVPAQVGQVVRQRLRELIALLDHRRQHGEAEPDEGRDDAEEHDPDGHAATHPAGDQPLHDRAQADGKEQRHRDEHEHAARLQ